MIAGGGGPRGEGIGLRSTRIRTRARTVVSIPNAEFAVMTLENLSRRDRNLLQTRLRIALDTGPAQADSERAGHSPATGAESE